MQHLKTKSLVLTALLFAGSTCLQAQHVTIKPGIISMKKAMSLVKKQTGYSFVFSSGTIKNPEKQVHVSLKNCPLTKAVGQILSGEDVDYQIQGRSILVSPQRHNAPAQSSTQQSNSRQTQKVRGHVVDASGEPVIGATVREARDSAVGTITDQQGNFELEYNPQNEMFAIYKTKRY